MVAGSPPLSSKAEDVGTESRLAKMAASFAAVSEPSISTSWPGRTVTL